MIASPPGFYGKLTSHGDFVRRRLPDTLVETWDGWLQQSMLASRQQLGGDWLAHYLTSPVWRFAIAEGIVGEQAWAGVMMPSVDRVGRHYPLMLAAPAAASVPLTDWIDKGSGWYDALEALAFGSLAADFVFEDFDRALAAQPVPAVQPAHAAAPSSTAWRIAMPEPGRAPDALVSVLAQGRSLWWSEGSPSVEPSMLVCQGLPATSGFAAMLAGGWQAHGWAVPRPA